MEYDEKSNFDQAPQQTPAIGQPGMDITKIVEMAKLMGSILSPSSSAETNQQEQSQQGNTDSRKENGSMAGFDIGSIMQIMQMLQTFFPKPNNTVLPTAPTQPIQTIQPAISDQYSIPLHSTGLFFDEMIHTPEIKVIKSAIPFMEPQHQKVLGVMTKCMELKQIMDTYHEDNMMNIQSMRQSHPNWKSGMLLAIKPHCTQEKQYMVDMLSRVVEIKDIASKMGGMQNSSEQREEATVHAQQKPQDMSQVINTIQPMLNDQQKQMLSMFSALMGNQI